MTVSPGLVLGALLVLVGAQVTRIVAPGHRPYLWVLVLAAGGFLAGEYLAVATRSGGPTLGVLHPVSGMAGLAVAEVLGGVAGLLLRRRRSP